MTPLLELDDVTVQFGGLKAVSDVDLTIHDGELIGLIGPNGAGKTTVFNLVTGVYAPTSGTIRFDGKSVAGRQPYLITARGIARTFQNIRLFASLSVLDNIRVAARLHNGEGYFSALWRGKGFSNAEAETAYRSSS